MSTKETFYEDLLGRKLEKIGIEIERTQIKSVVIFVGSMMIRINGIYGSDKIQLINKYRDLGCLGTKDNEKLKYMFGQHGKTLCDIKITGTVDDCSRIELIFDGDTTSQVVIEAKKLDEISNFYDGSLNVIENNSIRAYKERISRIDVKNVVDSWAPDYIVSRQSEKQRPDIEAILALVAIKSDVYEIAKGIREIFRYYFGEGMINYDISEYLEVAIELNGRIEYGFN